MSSDTTAKAGTAHHGSGPALTPRSAWFGLIVLALPALVTSVDLSVLFLALPAIVQDVGGSAEQQLWMLDIYGFVVASLLIPMGALGDRIGRRRLLMAGALGFMVFSLMAAFAPNAETLLVARAGLGVAGATLAPSSLALLKELFSDEKTRQKAIGIWTMCFMGGSILGPIIGGLLLSGFWWGSVFLMAVPVMLLVLVAGPKLFPETRAGDSSVDRPSLVLAVAALFPIVYGITAIGRDGLTGTGVGSLLLGLVVGAAFITRQRRAADPLLDVGLFRQKFFPTITALSLFGGAVQGGGLLMITLYLQTVLGYSPLKAGLLLIPTGVAMFIGIGLGGALGAKIRPATVIAAGLTLSAVGYLVVSSTQAGEAFGPLAGYGAAMVGLGPGMALSFGIMLSSVPPEKTASASAVTEAAGQFGVATGIAVLGSVGAAIYSRSVDIPSGLSAAEADRLQSSVSEGVAVASANPSSAGALEAVHEAFTNGLQGVALVAAAGFVVMIAVTLIGLRQVPPMAPQQEDQQEEPEAEVVGA